MILSDSATDRILGDSSSKAWSRRRVADGITALPYGQVCTHVDCPPGDTLRAVRRRAA
jgi:hypothetical protein